MCNIGVMARPLRITFSNVDNLPPETETNIWSQDPATGSFGVVGIGRVSADGSVIETISAGSARRTPSPAPPLQRGILDLKLRDGVTGLAAPARILYLVSCGGSRVVFRREMPFRCRRGICRTSWIH